MAQNKTSKQKDQYTVVLENLRSDFKIFGEKLQLTEEKFEKRFDEAENRFDKVENRFDNIENRFDKVEEDLDTIKTELSIIRNDLKEKVSREEFKLLETRVLRLENTKK